MFVFDASLNVLSFEFCLCCDRKKMQIEFELPGIDPEEFNRPLGDITIPEIVSMHSGMRLTSLLSQSAFSRVTIGV